MNRFALCGVVLGLASLGFAQDLTKKISVDIPASRATVALSELGKAAGITFQPAGNLKDDVFVISAHDQTIDDIMQRIAQAESGKWLLQSGLYLLTRENSTSVEQQRAELKARTDAVAAAIAKLTGTVAQQPKFDQATAQKLADETKRTLDQITQPGGNFNGKVNLGSTPDKTPSARAVAKVLASIDPSKLADIGPNQRVVFSTSPTPMQKSLNGVAARAFSDFITEQSLYTEAYNANQPQDGNTRMIMMNGLGTPNMGNGNPKLGLGVGLVVVQRGFDGGLSVQILAADPNYDTIATGSYNLQLPRAVVSNNGAAGEQPLKISDEAKEMAKALSNTSGGSGGPGRAMMVRAFAASGDGGGFNVTSDGGGGSNVKISPELRAKVLHPEQYDPMSFVPGEAMRALGAAANKNVVALLPDSCFGSLTRQFANDVTASQLLASLTPTHALISKQDDNWIVVSPGLPASARVNTVNRAALGSLLRSMDKNDTLRLDEVANFALAQDKVPGMNDFDILYPRLINDSITNRSLTPLATGSYSLYKFFATLSSGQRDAIGSGRQIPFTNYSSQQLALIADMLYNSPQGPTIQQDQPNRPGQAQGQTFSFTSVAQTAGGPPMPMFFAGGLSAKTERTIVVPNGVTNDGFIVGSFNNQVVTQGINSQNGSTSFMDASTLAFSKGAAGQNQLVGFTPPSYDKYRMGHQMNLSIRFLFSPRVSMSRSLSDTTVDADSVAGPYESLPADFRKQVDQMAQTMQQAFNKIPGRIGQGTPPPPQ
jgi:hypothetical protein